MTITAELNRINGRLFPANAYADDAALALGFIWPINVECEEAFRECLTRHGALVVIRNQEAKAFEPHET